MFINLIKYPALTNSVVVRHASVDVVDYFFEPLNNEKSFPNNVLLFKSCLQHWINFSHLTKIVALELFVLG